MVAASGDPPELKAAFRVDVRPRPARLMKLGGVRNVRRTLLRNARVIDGTGHPAFDGHVLIEGDRIKDILRGTPPLPQADTAPRA